MLVDLTPIIRKGIIDNTQRGVVGVSLWCSHDEQPIHMQLSGNCLQDIAGCRVSFSCSRAAPAPSISRLLPLHKFAAQLRSGKHTLQVGDITLSRKAPSQRSHGMLANMLSIELFVDTHIRLLIESESFEYELSLPEWECSAACAGAQSILNMSALRDHVQANVQAYRGPSLAHMGEDMPACRWDSILNRAEACMAIIPTIHDKYAQDPRGLAAELFVMDRPDMLGKLAAAEERKGAVDMSGKMAHWEIVDFVSAEEKDRLVEAMNHPLFDATAQLSTVVQRHILTDINHYRHSREVEDLVAQLAGTISQVLSTILLAQDDTPPPTIAIARAERIITRLEKLKFYNKALKPKAAQKFTEGLDMLLHELRAFVCTLRS